MCQSAPFLLLLLGAIASLAGSQLFGAQLFSTDRGAFFGRFFVGSTGVPSEGGQPHSVREIVTVSEHPGTFGQTRAWVPMLRGRLVAPVSWAGRPGVLPGRVWEEASVLASMPQPAVSEDTRPLLRSAKLSLSHGEQAWLVALFVVLLLLAGVSRAAVCLALLKCHSNNMGENNLRPLGEALAPVPEEVGTWQQWVDITRPEQPAIKASVVASKDVDKQAVSAYVSGIYERACGRVEGRASRAYLARLYERAAA